jgi:hypothetical protein
MDIYCLYIYGFYTVQSIPALYKDSTTIKWQPIDYPTDTHIEIKVRVEKSNTATECYGVLGIYLYELPQITRIYPLKITNSVETYLTLYVNEVQLIKDIYWKVGSDISSTVFIEQQGRIIIWKIPSGLSASPPEEKEVFISIDGIYWFKSPSNLMIAAHPTITSIDPTQIQYAGEEYLKVLGTDMSQYVHKCRLMFTDNQIWDLQTEYVSSTEVRWLQIPPNYRGDSGIKVFLSVNGIDFIESPQTFSYIDTPKVYSLDRTYGIFKADNRLITVNGKGFTNANYVSVDKVALSLPFTPISDSVGTFNLPEYLNISSLNATLYGDPSASVEVGITGFGRSDNEIGYIYLENPEITSVTPKNVLKDIATDVIVSGIKFFDSPSLVCAVYVGNTGVTHHLPTVYLNKTDIQCSLPAFSDTGSTYEMMVSNNGEEFYHTPVFTSDINWDDVPSIPRCVLVTAEINVESVDPSLIFITNSKDKEILVKASPILDLVTLSCKVHDYVIPGEYEVINSETYVKWIIPSYDVIYDSAISPLSPTGEVYVRVSNNGIDFSGVDTSR